MYNFSICVKHELCKLPTYAMHCYRCRNNSLVEKYISKAYC